MRLLFVSGTTVGGSGRSQRELASRLAGMGHEVLFLVDPEHGSAVRRWTYEQLSDLSVRWGRRPASRALRWLEARPGRTVREVEIDGLQHVTTPVPENAIERTMDHFRPDVVLGNSLVRLTWRKVRAACARRGVPTVLYIREVETLNHFEEGEQPANLVVANAESLARRIEALGFTCQVVPSVIEVSVTQVTSSREVALVVNPIASRGVGTLWQIASRLGDVRFVAQESWPLGPDDLESVEQHLATLGNVEFRRASPPGPDLYRDARALLVPYRVDNRPRVIAEAQANGIPVVVADSPALVEAAGSGGIVVGADDVDAWCAAIESLWTDRERYDVLSQRAWEHSQRDEISADAVSSAFEHLLVDLPGAMATPSPMSRPA
jgi:glycosyltransferase involved in cell wall biosynthesis